MIKELIENEADLLNPTGECPRTWEQYVQDFLPTVVERVIGGEKGGIKLSGKSVSILRFPFHISSLHRAAMIVS